MQVELGASSSGASASIHPRCTDSANPNASARSSTTSGCFSGICPSLSPGSRTPAPAQGREQDSTAATTAVDRNPFREEAGGSSSSTSTCRGRTGADGIDGCFPSAPSLSGPVRRGSSPSGRAGPAQRARDISLDRCFQQTPVPAGLGGGPGGLWNRTGKSSSALSTQRQHLFDDSLNRGRSGSAGDASASIPPCRTSHYYPEIGPKSAQTGAGGAGGGSNAYAANSSSVLGDPAIALNRYKLKGASVSSTPAAQTPVLHSTTHLASVSYAEPGPQLLRTPDNIMISAEDHNMLNASSQQQHKSVPRLEAELQRLQFEFRQNLRILQARDRELQQSHSEKNSLRVQLECFQKELQEKDVRFSVFEKRYSDERIKFEETLKAKTAEIEGILEKGRTDRHAMDERFREQAASWEEKHGLLKKRAQEAEGFALAKERKVAEDLHAVNEKLKTHKAKFQAALHEKDAEIERFRQDLHTEYSHDKARLESKNAELLTHKERTEQRLKNETETSKQLQSRVYDLEKRAKDNDAEARFRFDGVCTELSELKRSSELTIKQLELRLEELERENQVQEDANKKMWGENCDLQKQVQDLGKSETSLKRENGELSDKFSQLTQQTAAQLKQKSSELADALEKLAQERIKMEEDFNLKHHASEKKHLVDKENSVKPLRNEIRLLTDSLERITRECREVKAKAEQFYFEAHALNNECKILREENAGLKLRLWSEEASERLADEQGLLGLPEGAAPSPAKMAAAMAAAARGSGSSSAPGTTGGGAHNSGPTASESAPAAATSTSSNMSQFALNNYQHLVTDARSTFSSRSPPKMSTRGRGRATALLRAPQQDPTAGLLRSRSRMNEQFAQVDSIPAEAIRRFRRISSAGSARASRMGTEGVPRTSHWGPTDFAPRELIITTTNHHRRRRILVV